MAKRKFGFESAVTTKTIETEVKKIESVVDVDEQQNSDTIDTVATTQVQKLIEKIDIPVHVNTAFNFKYIRRDKLDFHTENDYPMEHIEKLAESILNFGLINNLEVFYNEDEDKYVIDSGERRTRAIDLLINRFSNYEDTENEEYKKYLHYVKPLEEGYPCNVKTLPRESSITNSEQEILARIEAEMRIIIANEEVREKNTVQTQNHVAKLNELYTQRNDLLSRKDKINVNKKIAEDLKITDRQVKTYKAINKLIPELQELFNENQITLSDGANYAQLNEEEQRQILGLIEHGAGKNELKELMKELEVTRKELDDRNIKIRELTEKNKSAMESLQENEEKMAKIREEIEQELASKNPNTIKIDKLQEQNETLSKELKIYKNTIRTVEEKKQQIIDDLEEKLSKKETMTTADKEIIKSQLLLDEITASFDQIFNKLVTTLADYKEKCTASDTDQSADDYLISVNNIINKYIDKLK